MALERWWFSPGHNRQLWGGPQNTYTTVAWDQLPPLDGRRHDGTFAWLAEQEETYGIQYGMDEDDPPGAEDIAERVARVVAAAETEGLEVPRSFLAFMESGERTYRRIPTVTACYLEVPRRVVAIEGEPGRMLRFMNDQQCCLVWGLHLLPGGGHRVVAAVPDFDGRNDGPDLEDAATLVDYAICADDFEEFIHRFWLENVLWKKARSGMTELTPEMSAYVEHAVAHR